MYAAAVNYLAPSVRHPDNVQHACALWKHIVLCRRMLGARSAHHLWCINHTTLQLHSKLAVVPAAQKVHRKLRVAS